MALPPSYNDIQSVIDAAIASGDDYKAIVCVFKYGGCDSANMIVPYDGDNSWDGIPFNARVDYELNRENGVRMEQDEITSHLLGTTPNWGLHPNLSYVKQAWDNNELAYIFDLGLLNKPTNKQQFVSGDSQYRRQQLYAHNIQNDQWFSGLTNNEARDTGLFGRTSSLIDRAYNGAGSDDGQILASSSFSVSGTTLQVIPYSPTSANFIPPTIERGIVDFNLAESNYTFNVSRVMNSDIKFTSDNKIYSAMQYNYMNAVNNQKSINDGYKQLDNGSDAKAFLNRAKQEIMDTNDEDIQKNVYWVDLFERALSVINSRSQYKQRRQMIFIGIGGWDHHNELRSKHDSMIFSLDKCYGAFIDALKSMGVYDNVVTYDASEFTRTLSSNGTMGTDHAYSSHNFVFGGSVDGGKTFPTGYVPNYTVTGTDVVDDGSTNDGSPTGRFIPLVSTDVFYAKLLEWFGVPTDQLHKVITALPNYTTDGADPNKNLDIVWRTNGNSTETGLDNTSLNFLNS